MPHPASLLLRRLGPLLLAVLASGPAWAHTEAGAATGGFTAGLRHPVLGLDHVVAMVAVGLWGAFLGRPAIWLLPVLFPTVMALGGVIGVMGWPMPGVEIGIALSAVVIGAAVAGAWRSPLPVAAVVVGAFAIFHGYAHGAELPEAANAWSYSFGFILATGALHLAGVLIGLGVRWPFGRALVRVAGGVIALAGAVFLRAAL